MKRFLSLLFCGLALAVGAHAQLVIGFGQTGQSGAGANVFSNAPTVITGTTYSVLNSDTAIIVNGSASCTLTLPSGLNTPAGRTLMVKTVAAFTVISASSNVVPVAGGSAATAMLAATAGKFAVLVYDGTSWQTMVAN